MSKEKELQELSDRAVKLREGLFAFVDALRPVTIVVRDANPNNDGESEYKVPVRKDDEWTIGVSFAGDFQCSDFQAKDHLWEDFSSSPTEIRVNPYD